MKIDYTNEKKMETRICLCLCLCGGEKYYTAATWGISSIKVLYYNMLHQLVLHEMGLNNTRKFTDSRKQKLLKKKIRLNQKNGNWII